MIFNIVNEVLSYMKYEIHGLEKNTTYHSNFMIEKPIMEIY